MRYVYDHDLHIHSKISLCSNDPEQTNGRILQYAKDNHLSTICLTDHFWDESIPLPAPNDFYRIQSFSHITKAKPLPQAEGIRFLFGCETEMDQFMTVGITKERLAELDFIIVPTTHFHFKDFCIPASFSTAAQEADFWLKKLHLLLDMDLPFHKIGVAHLTCGLIAGTRELYLETLEALPTAALEKVFTKAAKCGVGIELNAADMNYAPQEAETVLRPYRIAKGVGCKFYFGSDAHHPASLEKAPAIFERTIDALGLTEEDKFRL